MENIIDNDYTTEGGVSQSVVGHLRTAGNWGIFLSVLGFIGVAMMLVVGLFLAIGGSVMGDAFSQAGMPFPISILGIVYFVIAAVYFFPVLYMFRFSSKAQAYAKNRSNSSLNDAMANLAAMFKFSGIMVIAILILYVILIIGMVIFAGTTGM